MAKCSGKLDDGYTKVEHKGGCPTTGNAPAIEDFMNGCTQSVTDALIDGPALPDIAACADCGSELADCEAALATACIAANNPDTCSPFVGHTDWRLPNVMELFSLVSFATFDPTTSAEFHTACTPGCTTNACSCTARTFDYWSSTAPQDDTTRSRYMGFFNGNVGGTIRGVQNHVRAVRTGN